MKKLQKGSLAVAVVAAACWMNSKPALAGVVEGKKCPDVGYATSDVARCNEQEAYNYTSTDEKVYTCTSVGAVATDTCDTRPRVLAGRSTTAVATGGKIICDGDQMVSGGGVEMRFAKDYRSSCSGGTIPEEDPEHGVLDGEFEIA